ncbi:unnamed protein product [Closterium sp. Naga37s-1]|nr:unnamed protein product [Closterium sp. Naga37s-1]
MFRKNPSGRPHSHTHSDAQSASEEAAGARASSPYTLDPASLSDWLRAHGWRMSNPLPDPAFREQDEEGGEEEGGWGALMKEGAAAAAAGDSDSEGAEGAGAGVAGAGTGGASRGNAAAAAAAASAGRPITDSLSADSIPAEANATFLRLLQQQGDYACALWVRNVCYAFNPLFHSVPVANHEIEKIMLRERITDRHVGVWFWKDPRYDLSRLNLSENICTGKSALQPLRKEHFSSADVRDVPELSGRVGPFVHASDADLFFLHGRPPAHPVPAAAAGTSSSSSSGGGGGSSSSSSGYSGSAFTTNNASFAISVEQPEEWRGVGVVSLRDGHLGHFVEFIGAMTELASHLPTGKRDTDVPGTQVAAGGKDSPGREVASGGGTAADAAAAAGGDSAGSAGAGAGAGDADGVSGGAAAAAGGDGGKEGGRVDVQPVLFFPSGAGISRWVAAAGAVAMRGPQAMRDYQGMRVPQAMREHQGTKDHAGMRGLKGTRQQIKKGEVDTAGESGAALAAGGEAVTSAGGTPVAAESTPAVEAGRVWTHTTCFQDAFFPLSIAHAPSSADLFRLWVAQGAGLGKTLKAQQADPRVWTDEIERVGGSGGGRGERGVGGERGGRGRGGGLRRGSVKDGGRKGVEKGVEKGDVGEKNGERKGGGKGGRGSGEGEKKIDKKGRSSGEDKKDEEKGKKNGGSEKKVEKGGRSSEGSEKNANASVSGGERRKGTDKHSERDKGGGNGGNGGNGGKRRNEREDGKEEKAGEKGGDWKISRPGKGGEKKGVISHVSGASVVSTASGVRRAATGRGSMKSHSSRHLLQLQLRKGDLPVRHLKAEGTTNVSSRERQQQQRRQLGHGESGRRAAGRRVAWQITVVERKGMRTISNFRPMVGLLRAVFPHLPVKVVSLEAMPFAAQVRAMHRTALLVSMHGASMANVVLLQKGAAALEIMPYMWHYGAYKRWVVVGGDGVGGYRGVIALRWGVHYFMWRNEHRNLSTYTDNCLDANGFSQWQPAKCHTVTACRACIRDQVVTEVHLGELRSALLAAKEVVDQWELRRGRSFVELSDDLTADG